MISIAIDEEMIRVAIRESKKRDEFIKHHFEVGHLTYQERNEIGFKGEFACCKLLGIDWKNNIREDYHTIDTYDIIYKQKRIDVKTETIPNPFASTILTGAIADDSIYGRRLINENQFPLLSKYDIVIFGMFVRGEHDEWFPIGFLESDFIIKNHTPQKQRPDGGEYPYPASAVKTSELRDIKRLLEL